MMQDFRLLILDEPTAAMDMESSLLAEKLMGDYCRRSGCALVLITHSLQQAERMADELLFFHEGRLLEGGEKRRLLSSPAGPELRRFLDFYGSGGDGGGQGMTGLPGRAGEVKDNGDQRHMAVPGQRRQKPFCPGRHRRRAGHKRPGPCCWQGGRDGADAAPGLVGAGYGARTVRAGHGAGALSGF